MHTKLFLLLFLCLQNSRLVLSAKSLEIDSPDDPIFRDCTLSENKLGFCVQISYCLSLLGTLNRTSINQRRCGPSNENKKKPQICCESNLIQVPSTTTQSPAPSSITCGVASVSIPSRISGGEKTFPEEFPWMARLLRKDRFGDYTFSCTGVLISPKVVLTTAHCLVTPDLVSSGSLDAVILGEHEIECGFGDIKCIRYKKQAAVAETISHPNYEINSTNHDNDIGLIILKNAVEFSNSIAPICVLEEPYEANYYYISGWGVTENGGLSNVKLKTTLPPYSWNQCVDKFKNISVTLTTHQICAGGVKGQDTCQGDSGGPLMVSKNGRWYAAGLVSYGLGCGRDGWPAVYTNVPAYRDWIQKKMTNS